MNAVKVETTIQIDGELHLKDLPLRKGDRIEAVLLRVSNINDADLFSGNEESTARAKARADFLELAAASQFRSSSPYPTRDELHERD